MNRRRFGPTRNAIKSNPASPISNMYICYENAKLQAEFNEDPEKAITERLIVPVVSFSAFVVSNRISPQLTANAMATMKNIEYQNATTYEKSRMITSDVLDVASLFIGGEGALASKSKSTLKFTQKIARFGDDFAGLFKRVLGNTRGGTNLPQKIIGSVDDILKKTLKSNARAGNKVKPQTDFYVNPNGEVIPASGNGSYSNLQNGRNFGPGKNFTKAQKEKIIQENMDRNSGVVKSDLSGEELIRPVKSESGVTPPQNEWQIDHIFPKDKGGPNSTGNAQVLSRKENRTKSNK